MPATENVTTEVSEMSKNSLISMRKAKPPPKIMIPMMFTVESSVMKNEDVKILPIPSSRDEAINNRIAIRGDRNRFVYSSYDKMKEEID